MAKDVKQNSKKLNIIDLFAGCGGLTDGFEQTGYYNTIACVEWEKSFCDTLARRLENKWGYKDAARRVIRFDIQRTSQLLSGYKKDIEYGSGEGLIRIVDHAGSVDLIIGGPPCQAYSVAGRIRDKHKMKYDYRNYLFESYLKIVEYFQPIAFLFENVPGMLSAKPGNILITDRIRKSFDAVGYEIIDSIKKYALLDVSDYGIPQFRKRVILLGLRKEIMGVNNQELLEDFYTNILDKFKEKDKKTVEDAISDLPKFTPRKVTVNGKKLLAYQPISSDLQGHIPRFHNERDIAIFRELAYDIYKGNGKYNSVQKLKKLYTEKTGKISNIHKYFVLNWKKPSNTIVAHLHKDGLRHIHPDYRQARSITVREAARLQSFDDDFEFLGSMCDQYKMIGNAVPPRFAAIQAEALYIFLNKYKIIQQK